MIKWIQGFFTKETIKDSSPKCSKCGLIAKYKIKITFNKIDGEEESSIDGLICKSCEEDLQMEYNPMWLPPFIYADKEE